MGFVLQENEDSTKTPFEEYIDIIPDFISFQNALKEPFLPEFRINKLRCEVENVLKILEVEKVMVEILIDGLVYRTDLNIKLGNLVSYKLGYIYPQALTSVIAGLALDPKPNSFVLDMCAAPGSKTTLLAQLMQNTGLIVANELYKDRLPALGENICRLGVTNTIITCYQAQEFPRTHLFDYVMADVPCSSEGNFRLKERQKPPKKWKLERLIDIQKRIILRGYELLKPGGIMVYSTCTYNPMENEGVVDYLLQNTDAELLPFDSPIPSEPGITEWLQNKYNHQLSLAKRFYPHRTGSVGFFMARIRKPS